LPYELIETAMHDLVTINLGKGNIVTIFSKIKYLHFVEVKYNRLLRDLQLYAWLVILP
jgi:hypothetical protein